MTELSESGGRGVIISSGWAGRGPCQRWPSCRPAARHSPIAMFSQVEKSRVSEDSRLLESYRLRFHHQRCLRCHPRHPRPARPQNPPEESALDTPNGRNFARPWCRGDWSRGRRREEHGQRAASCAFVYAYQNGSNNPECNVSQPKHPILTYTFWANCSRCRQKSFNTINAKQL